MRITTTTVEVRDMETGLWHAETYTYSEGRDFGWLKFILAAVLMAGLITVATMAPATSGEAVEAPTPGIFNPKARVDAGEVFIPFIPAGGEYLPYHVEGHGESSCWIEKHYGEYIWCPDGYEHWPNGEPGGE